MIKCSIQLLSTVLLKLFNGILKQEIYPDFWNEGYILPIFKNGDRKDPSNYRGITISNCLGKLFTKIINNRLMTFLVDNNIIKIKHIGFIPNKRTSDHKLVLKTIIEMFKKQRKTLYMCFVDLKKAFDTVFHSGLIYKAWESALNSSTL